jgi:hypothetical protein
MSVYPFEIDSDATIIRIDDNLSEIGGQSINQLRSAVFAIETELGTRPSGSKSTVAGRLDVSLNPDGTIKSSALTSVGLAVLPITNAQVATNAGIAEFKLALDHSTSDLNTLIASNTALLNALTTFTNEIDSDISTHVAGGTLLSDGSQARHVASHIDINAVGTDTRDPAFTWAGIKDKDGNLRTGTNVAAMMQQINDAFTAHQNAVSDAHVATAITINTDNFTALPFTLENVQEFADYIDDFQQIVVGGHIATQHANTVPLIARPYGCSLEDGYKQNVVPPTTCSAYLVRSPATFPVDDISSGDNIIKFVPDNTGNAFDALFSQVEIGDQLTINYGTGFEATFLIDSLRFVPGSEWVVRVNGTNLSDSDVALAQIDKPVHDRRTEGILALASANATPTGSFNNFLSSVIIGNPRGAMAIGFGFDPGQLDASHYNLYLELYPTGNPTDYVIQLPAVDVTGNAGTTPGKYTLESAVQATNNKFREIGYNYRFIAFAENGNFGLMLADAINCASFAIISGRRDPTGTLLESIYTSNVISQFSGGTSFDALGLGAAHADVASPSYSATYVDEIDAQTPTKVVVPLKRRNYVVNGTVRDNFAPTWNANLDANRDGYWDGYIAARTPIGAFTIETTYEIPLDLKAAGLKPGKTIVVQPTVSFADAAYFDVDYGRFIIKNVTFIPACPGESDCTQITVINGIHAKGTGFTFSSGADLNVKIYFSEDSVGFDNEQVINTTPTSDPYHRLHEIYVNDQGQTFSHERARMIIQSGGGSNLGTTDWHIQDVSSKLRGYRDSSSSFNKYIRFYILSYDTVSGEYDGYIGQRDTGGNSIFRTGPVTTGRKNVTTRFYDETYVDYVDLIFEEQATTSGASTDILGGTIIPRYVDVELFSSLKNHDENMLLGTVEVNWDPPTGQNIVQRVVNRRQFGSIDEEDFTEAAIDFITAVPRATQDNGIIRGFGFDMVNTSDERELYYKGGVALVNGRIVTTNRQSVTIPEIAENPNAVDSIDWAVCVNEAGELIPVVITPTKQEFYAIDNTSTNTYYLVSSTFAELVETRKDLVPIDVVTADIASFTLGSNADVRRFLTDGKKRELVFSPEDYAGTFHTSTALKNWVNKYSSSSPLVVNVRGTFDVDTTIDLTGFVSPVILDGDGAIFNVTANKGFLIDANLTIRNALFNYNPSSPPTYTTGDKINSANGCIYQGDGTNVQNVTIKNCTFLSAVTTQRPPFISLERQGTDTVEELYILNNRFSDANVDPAEDQAAVAIISLNTTGATPALVINSRIDNNVCNNHQGIYITCVGDTNTVNIPGLAAVNVTIAGNSCGVIGFLTTSTSTAVALDTRTTRTKSIDISLNSVNIIANIANYFGGVNEGTAIVDNIDSIDSNPTGPFSIHDNFVHWINVGSADDDPDFFALSSITNNRLTAYDSVYLDQWFALGTVNNSAIVVNDNGSGQADSIISHNTITAGKYNSTDYFYDTGIDLNNIHGTITENIIKGLAVTTGVGISTPTGSSGNITITGNKIDREGRSIARYIFLSTSGITNGICAGNVFDDFTIDGSNDEAINGFGSSPVATAPNNGWIVERNKNQTVVQYITNGIGNISVQGFMGPQDGNSTTATANYQHAFPFTTLQLGTFTYDVGNAGNSVRYGWLIDGRSAIPADVKILEISITTDGSADCDTADDNDLFIEIASRVSGVLASSTPGTGVVTSAIVTHTLSDPGDFTNIFNSIDGIQVRMDMLLRHATNQMDVIITEFKIKYRW